MHLEVEKKELPKVTNFISCCVCGNKDYSLKYVINCYNVVKCNICGFFYLNPPPDPTVLDKIYTKEYFRNPAFNTLDTERYYGYDIYIDDKINIQNKFKKCLRYLKKYSNGGRLLDIGCATGFFLELARQEGWETIGIEASDFACEYAREKLGLDVIRSSLIDAKFKAQSFDVVTMWDLIEHLLDPLSELLEVNRIMKIGGILGIITPDIGALIPRILGKNWLELRRIPAHLSFFSVRTLKQFLNRTGFDLLETRTIGKKFSMDSLVKNLRFHDKLVFKKRWMLIKYLPLKTFPFTINPFYKILAFARKVEEISDKPDIRLEKKE
ncbi:MAG: class I SAM-dependent methyltransferase [Deltaproteobacteria bacterium]|nr:MAG: class I SAM-dependent methyltransferase [Deltaproteobacteria bacterium]